MKIRVYVMTNLVGSKVEEEIDTVEDWGMDDRPTNEELTEAVQDWANERMEFGWKEIE